MNDFQRVKSEVFVTISNTFLKDKNLSNKTKGVLAMILSLPESWDFSIKGMAAITKDGESSLRSAINEMKEHGYCAVKPVRINNKIARWKYLFSGDKLTESLLCDFLQVENLQVENQAQYNNILNDNNKEIKKEENNKLFPSQKVKKNTRFVKPTIDEVEAYIQEKGYHFDAERFINHYESVGWMIGKNHMKDWKASCRTWECRYKTEHKEKEEESDGIIDNRYDDIQFKKQQEWMQHNTPKIADKITLKMMNWFRERSFCDGNTLRERLIELNEVYDGGDIVELFKVMYLI